MTTGKERRLDREFKQNSCLRKVRYLTEQEVFWSAEYMSHKREIELNYYLCKFCKGFHMTKRKGN